MAPYFYGPLGDVFYKRRDTQEPSFCVISEFHWTLHLRQGIQTYYFLQQYSP